MPVLKMTPEVARAHLDRLQISQQAFARLIRVNPTTVRRWLRLDGNALDIPRPVAFLLPLLTLAHVRQLTEDDKDTVDT